MRTRNRHRQRQQQQVSPIVVEPISLEKPEVTMADNRTMAEMLQAPTEGYEDAIVVPAITADNFELKHSLLNLVQNKQFFGHDKEDPHAHIRYFNKITSTMKFPNVPSTSVKLMLFPFSLEGAARIWLEKEPPRSILTWDDLVSKFINQFFPPSKTTNIRNKIPRFQQIFDESFYEAWDRFNDLLRACPHHGFLELHQLDTFYNSLNSNDQDSLNFTTGVVAKVSMSASTIGLSPNVAALTIDVAELKDMMKTILLDKQKSIALAPVKAVEQICVTLCGAHSYRNCPTTDGNNYRDNIQEYVSQAAAANFNQGSTSYRPQMVANQVRPLGFPPIQNNQNNQNRFNKNWGNNFNQNRGNNFNQNRGNNYNQGPIYQPQVNQPLVFKAPPHQAPAPAPQPQGVSKDDFNNYITANDAVVKIIQNQNQNTQNQLASLTNSNLEIKSLLESLLRANANTASTSSSGSLPGNTIANLIGDMKAITIRCGVSYDGPQISPSVVEVDTEVTKDPVLPSTEDV
ncbi:reverse transcriptase domain-containing protein [Tanacetum coccineum]